MNIEKAQIEVKKNIEDYVDRLIITGLSRYGKCFKSIEMVQEFIKNNCNSITIDNTTTIYQNNKAFIEITVNQYPANSLIDLSTGFNPITYKFL